jgi:phage minor structural protein
MIPILYESTETTFTSNGIGRLSDAVSCVVSEERNGPYELEMEYPTTGIHYSDIQLFRIIFAVPADGKSGQPFEIYEISRPLNGVVTVRAWHLSYRLNKIVVKPFTAASCSAALTGLKNNSTTTNPFTFGTDKNVSANFTVKTPTECRGLLGGQAGSILDVFGKGDYEFDKFQVYLYTNRGADNGVTIRYGKNLTDLDAEIGMDTVYTGIVPYYYNEDTADLVTINGLILWGDHRSDYPVDMVKPVDLSDKWEESAPTKAQLLAAAQSYMDSNPGWELNTNLKVSFVALADTVEYKNVSALQRVNLCDTVTIIHEGLGVSATAKVVKTEYNVLLERYDSIELGTASVSLGQAIEDTIINSDTVPTTSEMQRAIQNGTALITGNSGGYVVLKKNANGQPEELLVMDSPNINTASNVWRWNSSGLGFSPNGYSGPYNTAWTYDGKFYVDWVTAGAINAALVNTGTISSADGKVQIVLSETGNTGQLIVNSSNFKLDGSGNLKISGEVNATSGKIGGSSGLVVDAGKLYYGKSSLTSGASGLYIGTDGFALGSHGTSGKKKPLLWYDDSAADETINVVRLSFKQTTNTSPYYEDAHDIVVDNNKRLYTGGGWEIGGGGSSGDSDASAEFNTEIHNYLWATIAGGSDRRIKEDIKDITTESAREFIKSARPVSFRFTKESLQPDGIHHGFVAQEMAECVNDDWNLVPENEKGMKFIHYQEIIADLVKVVQDQQARIEALEAALEVKE